MVQMIVSAKQNRDTDVVNKLKDTKGKRWGGMNGEIETDLYTPICMREKTNENRLHSTGNYAVLCGDLNVKGI